MSSIQYLRRSIIQNNYIASAKNFLYQSSFIVGKSVKNFSSTMEQPRHIAEGEEDFPALVPGSLRFYNMKYCPYAERTLLVLLHKNVKFDIVNLNLKNKPSWFLERSPLGKVPTLERADSDTITESLVTMDYLDDVYQEAPILPTDPWKKAQDKMLSELFSAKVINKIHKFYYSSPDEEQIKTLGDSLAEEMSFLEKELQKRGTKFFFGSTPGYLDFAMWPWFERLPILNTLFGVDLLNGKNPKIEAWIESMKSVPAVKTSLISPEEHLKFMSSFMGGTPDYNFNVSQKSKV